MKDLRSLIAEMTPEAVAARMCVAPAVVIGWAKHGVPADMTVDVQRTLIYLMKEQLFAHRAAARTR
jgi:hypothetical protein